MSAYYRKGSVITSIWAAAIMSIFTQDNFTQGFLLQFKSINCQISYFACGGYGEGALSKVTCSCSSWTFKDGNLDQFHKQQKRLLRKVDDLDLQAR